MIAQLMSENVNFFLPFLALIFYNAFILECDSDLLSKTIFLN